MALLEASGIGKNFGETHVLKDISLDLEQGEALAIIGSSGSGKTTLLRCINMLETADSGSITVDGGVVFDGSNTDKLSAQQQRENQLKIGLVFQSFNLFPQYTALENVTLAARVDSPRNGSQTEDSVLRRADERSRPRTHRRDSQGHKRPCRRKDDDGYRHA